MKLFRNLALLVAVCCGFLTTAHFTLAQSWALVTTLTNADYGSAELLSLSSSADGGRLEAAVYFGLAPYSPFGMFYASTNAGTTWTSNFPAIPLWLLVDSVAASADGTKLAAICSANGESYYIYSSTNAGISWTQTSASSYEWESIASSADGNTLVAVGWNGPICVSTNSGATWKATADPWFWTAVAASADGKRMVATSVARTNAIYVSSDYGTSWTATPSPGWFWNSVASSADGTKLVATALSPYGGIANSTNSGATWMETSAPNTNWISVASSADGTKLVAAANGGLIYTSVNSGATWSATDAPSMNWRSVVASADGNTLYAGNGAGDIWTLRTISSPQLNLASSSTNFTLAWTVPSTDCVLQQSSNLVSWASMTNTPVLNFTNLQSQVTLSPSNGSGFYRLKTL